MKVNHQFFSPATSCYALRGHDRKLVKTRSRLDGNSLPASVVQASVNAFKNAYDKHLAATLLKRSNKNKRKKNKKIGYGF